MNYAEVNRVIARFKVGGAILFALLIGLVSGTVINNAYGQDARTKTFPLGKPFQAIIGYCTTKQVAVEVARTHKDVGTLAAERVFGLFVREGKCAISDALVTYVRLVEKVGESNIYEVAVGDSRYFVITDWTHEGVRI